MEGVVTYSNEAKMERLGVKKETLEKFGAVSSETAREMVLVLLDIEKEYNITIKEEDVNSYGFMTINKIIKIINNK